MGFAPQSSPFGKARFSCKGNLLNWNFKGLERGWLNNFLDCIIYLNPPVPPLLMAKSVLMTEKPTRMLVILRKSIATPAYLDLLLNKTLHTDFL